MFREPLHKALDSLQRVRHIVKRHQARRHREKRWAGFRFWIVLVLVLVVAVVLAVRTLGEIERIFGL